MIKYLYNTIWINNTEGGIKMTKKEEVQIVKSLWDMGLIGLGFVVMTKEKIDSAIKELIKRGEVDAKTGKEMAQDLLKKSDKEREAIEKKIKSEAKNIVDKMDIVTKSDLRRLEQKIDRLSK
jgi:polyhydroxyalkanoate synthesis regulator phasin